ncbi:MULTISPECIES: cbb3-type cytochrome oxidase assembly protein CcoS [Dyella]|uniref:Cbb3-type cytochrome oxidase assembly protein CcoS n=2 Tax=Dyella TaxID=231454 RepID=A0A4R0Z0C2_9GAMM|nr:MULTISPECIES: cbb3-type cytochrome oxidase assembly protein CcoS [Dyella]TBR39338.1 cbb3-type cytochrome oxidase assembly protein CcoS [Dyella terrae]TCI13074.1 cbb3-type cytochrome oxidase assembly protein CcoS [Dyella soli]
MNILLVLIPVTTLIILIGVITFFWAVNHRQFDDLESPAILPLLEDADKPAKDDVAPPDETGTGAPSGPDDRTS